MNKIEELEATILRLKNIAIELRVDVNIRDARIVELEIELKKARREIASRNRETQTVRNLRVLDASDDDTGIDPRATGRFGNPWDKVR